MSYELAEKIGGCTAASVDPSDPRKICIHSMGGELIAEAISLSDDMIFATIHLDGGGFSNHYMPLRHFLELYSAH